MIRSLDTETTGLDLRHGARPYLVTMCDGDGNQEWWEWEVDPLTRMPMIPEEDLDEIEEIILSTDVWVLQNAKFDVSALATVRPRIGQEWPWDRTHDTIIAGHLLASNQPKDLTTMALVYMGVNIQPLDDAMKSACQEARRYARSHLKEWFIAKKDAPGMPSVSEQSWKLDGWLPRAIAKHLGYPGDHPWWTVTSEYANGDSAATIGVYRQQMQLIRDRRLMAIYEERRKIVRIAYLMEQCGVTINRERMGQLHTEFMEESERLGGICINIARSMGYELELPKSGPNKSIRTFIFDVLKMPPMEKSKKTGEPSLNKLVVDGYIESLPPNGKASRFLQSWMGKRKRDTAVQYLENYSRFSLPIPGLPDKWRRVHPSLNPTATDTLRWSSANPNEQSISQQEGFNLRYCFGPAPGREWWKFDAMNIELRIPAYESGEAELIALYERPNDPPYFGSVHMLNFHTVYPDLWDAAVREVGYEKAAGYIKKKYEATWYKWVKNGGFAVQYGAIEKSDGTGTADRAFRRPGSHARLKARFSKLNKLNQKMIDHAAKYGFVETIPDRSVDPSRGYPLLCSRSRWGKVSPTIPFNYHVQSTACWWIQSAMIRCQGYLDDLNRSGSARRYYMVMQVHDELDFDFPRGTGPEPWRTNLPKVRKLRTLMEQGGRDIGVNTAVGVEYCGQTWAEGITIKC